MEYFLEMKEGDLIQVLFLYHLSHGRLNWANVHNDSASAD